MSKNSEYNVPGADISVDFGEKVCCSFFTISLNPVI